MRIQRNHLETNHIQASFISFVIVAVRIVCIFASLLALLVAWAMSSPPGSSWAEREALLEVLCGSGKNEPQCRRSQEEPEELQVPAVLQFDEEPCFTGGASASCLVKINRDAYEGFVPEEIPNTEALYNVVLRTVVGDDPVASAMRIRLLVAVFAAMLLTIIFSDSRGAIRNRIFLWFALTSPVILSKLVEVGAHGLVFLATLSCAVGSHFVLTYWNRPRRLFRVSVISLIVFMATAFLVTSEEYGYLIVATALIAAFFTTRSLKCPGISSIEQSSVSKSHERNHFWLPVAPLIVIAITVAELFGLKILSSENSERLQLFTSNLLSIPDFGLGLIGGTGWSIGLNDTPMPWTLSLVMLSALSVITSTWWKSVSLNGKNVLKLMLVGILASVYLQQSFAGDNFRSDPELTTTVAPFVLVTASTAAFTNSRVIKGRTLILSSGLLVAAMALSLRRNLQRFVVGLGENSDSSLHCLWCSIQPRNWWWDTWYPSVTGPQTTWIVGVLGTISALTASQMTLPARTNMRSMILWLTSAFVLLSMSVRIILPWI